VTEIQRELARHALGLPNKKKESYRNHFCTGPGSTDFDDWEDLVAKGLATKRTNGPWGGDHMFYLNLKGALMACGPKERLSREDFKDKAPAARRWGGASNR